MEHLKSCFSVVLVSLLVVTVQSTIFDVTKYCSNVDGSDISKALTEAWTEACEATTPSQVLIPRGSYSLGVIALAGPCKAAIELHVQGEVKAPATISGDSWITFKYIDQFSLTGTGSFNGQGQSAWTQNDCGKNTNCKSLAVNLRFNFITNALVKDVSSIDSKNFHVNLLGAKNFTFQHFTVSAPKTSINTDGIHIGRSIGVNITDTKIGTGDDCISIGDGAEQIRITRVTCGPGHGISIGSLGKYPNEEPVSGIFVTNCTLSNTDNGVRIKTWPAKHGGTATDMHFEDVIMDNVANPVIIDQVYCPWNQCNAKLPSKVKISNVSFKNIRGTSTTPIAVELKCSSGIPCEDVVLEEIDLAYCGTVGTAASECTNVKPHISGKLNPAGC